MKRIFKKIAERLNYNPYAESVEVMKDLQKRNPNTPNLAKIAFYCNCEVEDIVKEICFVLKTKEE